MIMYQKHILAIWLFLGLGSTWSWANDIEIRTSGFATLGFIDNSSDSLGFHPNLKVPSQTGFSFKTDTLVGGQVNVAFNSDWEAVGQVVLRDRVDKDALNYVEMAFLRRNLGKNWAIRAGRMNTDLYFLSEYQSVGYAYLWARPPVEFYSGVSSISQVDGADILYKTRLDTGFLQFRMAYGATEVKLQTSGGDPTIEFDDLFTVSTIYHANDWELRASYLRVPTEAFTGSIFDQLDVAIAQVPSVFWPEAEEINNQLDFVGKKADFYGLGYKIENDTWMFQTELAYLKSNWVAQADNYSGYVSVGYQLADWTLYGIAAKIKPTEATFTLPASTPPPGTPETLIAMINAIESASNQELEEARQSQTTYSLGVRWNVNAKLVAKIQWDNTRVDASNYGFWIADTVPDSASRINVISGNISVVF